MRQIKNQKLLVVVVVVSGLQCSTLWTAPSLPPGNGPRASACPTCCQATPPTWRPDAVHPHPPAAEEALRGAAGSPSWTRVGLSSGQGGGHPHCRGTLPGKNQKAFVEFPASPVVRTRCFHCRAQGSIPRGHRSRIPQATWAQPRNKRRAFCETWSYRNSKEGWQLSLRRALV